MFTLIGTSNGGNVTDMLGAGSTVRCLFGSTAPRDGLGEQERTVSGTIRATLALTTRKMGDSVSERRKRSEGMWACPAQVENVDDTIQVFHHSITTVTTAKALSLL